ncbi:MAG: polysaccharide deacetylase family protein [Anaerosomatales bacterium]|nr:polysaccharide deacetylase family protein [Anaerosomatales bacterium]
MMRRLAWVAAVVVCATVVATALAGCVGSAERLTTSPWAPADRERPHIPVEPAPLSDDPFPEREPAPTPEPEPGEPTPAPSPGPAPPPAPSPSECASLSNTKRGWWYQASGTGSVPTIPSDVAAIVQRQGALWRVPTREKVIYLTFDQGYEAGFTGRILETLRSKGVKATFFLSGSYVRDEPGLVRRMASEGHLVGNHTQTHPSLPSLAGDADAFAEEYRAVERRYREVTGRALARFERPPRGEYSERTLCMVRSLGYTSVMWSFAHRDWLLDDQPPVDVTYQRIIDGAHPGAIMLLHSVSSSNTEALPRAIDELRSRGYRFATLDEAR